MNNLSFNLINDLNSYLQTHPEMKKHMKYFNKNFARLNFLYIVNWFNGDVIYNLFVADIEAVKRNGYKQIRQDFLVKSNNNWVYYSGQGNNTVGLHQHIDFFCQRYGRNQNGDWGEFGCNSKYRLSDHFYNDENDLKLQDPSQKQKRELIVKELLRIRKSFSTKPYEEN